ncbi:EamA family transporter [candidate division KSB1 bacterium]|nr:EamA family transporter [candidate division KSB1 bacterium]
MFDLFSNYVGEIAALTTSILWSFGSIFFTISSRAVGSVLVNRVRLLYATILLAGSHFFFYGHLLPVHAEPFRWWWLGLSGFIGLVLGDAMLFQAFVVIGTRLTMLLLSLVPIISSLFAWIFLGEILKPIQVFAIFLTVGGIIFVVLEKNENSHARKTYLQGILLGFGGAAGQALGLITAKKGLSGDFSGLSANLIRMVTAMSCTWLIAAIRGRSILNLDFWKNKTARWSIWGGAVFGPFLGVWLVMISIKHAHVGIASTLQALPPIFLIPLTHWIFKEKITLQSVIGTMIAMIGVAIIFLT